MQIAICSNIPVFWENKCLDKDWCARFPGAVWMPVFAELMSRGGHEVVSGDVAIEKIEKGEWQASDVFVIQELNAKHGMKLIKIGAVPLLLTGGESPLFSYYFYDNLWRIAPKFKYRMLFSGSFIGFNGQTGVNIPMRFPSFSKSDIRTTVDFGQRDFMVMVAANKSGYPPPPSKIGELKSWIIHRVYKLFSASFQKAQANELHSKRIDMIEHFGSRGLLSLFGSGWSDERRFKEKEKQRVLSIIKRLQPVFCEDKVKTISSYKFVVCFENISYPGYVTEKIIDCFVAGSIPVYCGAPDISDFVPKESYVDFREFKTLGELESYLLDMTKEVAMEKIEAAKKFLDSESGKKHSYEGFASDIGKLCLGQA